MGNEGAQSKSTFKEELHNHALGMLVLEPIPDQPGKFKIVTMGSRLETQRAGEVVEALSMGFPTTLAGIDVPICVAIQLEKFNNLDLPDAFVLGDFEIVGQKYRWPIMFFKLTQ